MRHLLLILALLLQPAAAPTLTAARTPSGIVVAWASPEYGCVRLTGINLDDMIACGQSGTITLDAGQAQYAGVGRQVGLWGGSAWLVDPIPLPGYVQALPDIAAPPSPRRGRVRADGAG